MGYLQIRVLQSFFDVDTAFRAEGKTLFEEIEGLRRNACIREASFTS